MSQLPTSPGYDTRITQITVAPTGQPLFSEMTTVIAIQDEADGEFVTVTQEGGHTDIAKSIAIDVSEWRAIKAAIDFMVSQCRSEP